MTSKEISATYHLSQQTIQWRTKAVGLRTQKGKRKHYTEEEVKKVVYYEKKPYLNTRFTNKNKIQIIEMYLKNTDNIQVKIAEELNLNDHYINRVINEWIENDKTITVKSKL